LAKKQQRLTMRLAEERVVAIGDVDVLVHVLVNLLSNASKFSAAGTTIDIELSAGPPAVHVRDEGQGMSPDDLSRLFDPAQRPTVRPTANESTSGDGLVLSHRWVSAMGGQLTCRSTQGQGSTFTVQLPASTSAK
jgi:signal transduction histidine kinase